MCFVTIYYYIIQLNFTIVWKHWRIVFTVKYTCLASAVDRGHQVAGADLISSGYFFLLCLDSFPFFVCSFFSNWKFSFIMTENNENNFSATFWKMHQVINCGSSKLLLPWDLVVLLITLKVKCLKIQLVLK